MNPLSVSATLADLSNETRGAFNSRGRHAQSRFGWRADMATAAHRLRNGLDVPQHRLGGPPLWARPNWGKFADVLDSKAVKATGIVGTVASTGFSFADHKKDGDSTTEAVMKTTIETTFAAGGASLLAPLGAGCGPLAPACSGGLGVLGAWGGGKVGGMITDTFDSQIGWAANRFDDGAGWVEDHVDVTFWN